MPLPERSAVEFAHWGDEIAAGVAEEFQDEVIFFEPGERGIYNPDTDKHDGATPDVALSRAAARVQPTGGPQDVSTAGGWGLQSGIRIQIIRTPGAPELRKGLIVRIQKAHRAPALEHLPLVLEREIGSTHSAVRTIECIAGEAITK